MRGRAPPATRWRHGCATCSTSAPPRDHRQVRGEILSRVPAGALPQVPPAGQRIHRLAPATPATPGGGQRDAIAPWGHLSPWRSRAESPWVGRGTVVESRWFHGCVCASSGSARDGDVRNRGGGVIPMAATVVGRVLAAGTAPGAVLPHGGWVVSGVPSTRPARSRGHRAAALLAVTALALWPLPVRGQRGRRGGGSRGGCPAAAGRWSRGGGLAGGCGADAGGWWGWSPWRWSRRGGWRRGRAVPPGWHHPLGRTVHDQYLIGWRDHDAVPPAGGGCLAGAVARPATRKALTAVSGSGR